MSIVLIETLVQEISGELVHCTDEILVYVTREGSINLRDVLFANQVSYHFLVEISSSRVRFKGVSQIGTATRGFTLKFMVNFKDF
jgi:hypothetical protein